jgi:hypothetical protein
MKLQLARIVDPITFTDEKVSVTRTITAILNPTACFPNVMYAISEVFPGCTNFEYKLIKSLANDPLQLLHTDFDAVHLIRKRNINLDSFTTLPSLQCSLIPLTHQHKQGAS